MSAPELSVFVGAPEAFAPRAAWVLETLLAPLGRRAVVTRDPAQAGGAALAYAPDARRRRADDPVRRRRDGAVRRGAAAAGRRLRGRRRAATARPSPPGRPTPAPASPSPSTSSPPPSSCSPAGTSAPPESATSTGVCRTPPASSPPTRSCASRSRPWTATPTLLRGALAPRLAALGLEPLPPAGSVWGARGRFAIALTHDLDNLWRWTRRGFAAAGYRTARAARHLQGRAVLRELGDGADWLVRHLPRRTDPFWTFPQILERRGRARRLLDLLRDRPPHAQAGRQPAGDLPAPHPRGAHSSSPTRTARSACTATTPTGWRWRTSRRTGTASPAVPAAPSPASATTTCARSTTRRCRCSSRPASPTTPPSRSPSTRASAAAARSRSARTRWPRSGRSTSSSCRSP